MINQTKKRSTTFIGSIIIPSLLFIIGISVLASLFPQQAQNIMGIVQHYIFTKLNWIYVVAVAIFIFFLLFLVLSKYGSIKLGADTSKPEYSFSTWVAMLFAAGMGIGLMYFGVAEPISHFADPAIQLENATQTAKQAQMYTMFHWGIHAWAIYAVVGLALSYFTYRYKLPLSLRSCFYPILKDKIQGRAGNIIDIFALCSTFFGLTTTLGFGVVQLAAGLERLGIINDVNFNVYIVIVTIIMCISIASASSGVNKGVKILSQVNIIVAVVFMLFVLITGPTVYLLGSFSEGIGNYMSNFMEMTFSTSTYSPDRQQWYFDWTIIYWAWWISWSPYVGLFIAKISKGRTIREFIIAVLLLPTLFNFLWMTIFGNSAIWLDMNVADGALSAAVADTDTLLFRFLEYLPFDTITSAVALLIICIFFITSADSGIYVMNNVASKNAKNSPLWQNIFWGVLLGALSLILLNLGGLESLQTMTLITALPFAIIMLLFCYSLFKGLYVDRKYYSLEFSPSTQYWTGAYWKQRLDKILTYGTRTDINSYLKDVVLVAFNELSEELSRKGIVANVMKIENKDKAIEIIIKHEEIENFKYGVKTSPKRISDYLLNEENAPQIDSSRIFVPITYFGDDRKGYDIQYFTKEEVISDVLKQYERFLVLIADRTNDLMVGSGNIK